MVQEQMLARWTHLSDVRLDVPAESRQPHWSSARIVIGGVGESGGRAVDGQWVKDENAAVNKEDEARL
ncbi:hypothetical protein E4U13_007311 [Claviceps humidiphila]|uniref:Uncharacterized protein n=1 Tax=Claviceps humidiphila TaxID=1294629 RepID=A0A9P7TWK7_9HYPO|nr:hypothetical protein E4U13_007311 [Claviceps humidiphila]